MYRFAGASCAHRVDCRNMHSITILSAIYWCNFFFALNRFRFISLVSKIPFT